MSDSSAAAGLRRQRLEQVERCLAADMPIAEWCRLNHIAESTVYRWMRRFREEGAELPERSSRHWISVARDEISSSSALAAVGGAAPAAARAGAACPGAAAITVALNGAAVSIPPGSDPSDVAAVLGAVVSL